MGEKSEDSNLRGCHDLAYKNQALYLTELISDKKRFEVRTDCFSHVERLLDEEITRVRKGLFKLSDIAVELPEPEGPPTFLSEKLFVPVKKYPAYNFVGRILGPGGNTVRQIMEQTGCQIMVRGRGSMRNKLREERLRGQHGWDHLSEDLHVLVTVEDAKNRAKIKLERAMERVKYLLIPKEYGDEFKKLQLLELSIMRGTYCTRHEGNPTMPRTVEERAHSAVTSEKPFSPPLVTPPLPLHLLTREFCGCGEYNPFRALLMQTVQPGLRGMVLPPLNGVIKNYGLR